jgi:hypothetical protein
MRKTIEEKVIVTQLVSITCDRCKRSYKNDMDLQEFLSYHNTGGYSSVFGDGAVMSLDLCQHCVKELLGDFIQFHDDVS